jgi:hypothetical protein
VDVTPTLIGAAVAVVLALIVIAAVVSVRGERRRRDTLRRWADTHGWAYVERPSVDWWRRLPGYDRRGVTLMLSGIIDGFAVSVAEYAYTETRTSTTPGSDSTTSTRTTHRFVVVVVRLPWAGPTVEVVSRHGLSKLGRALFGDRATALGYEPFDRAFRIASKDPDGARRLIGRRLADAHLAGWVPAWSLRGAELLTYRSGWLGEPDRIPETAAPLVRVATLLGR